MKDRSSVAVLGGGSWGTCLADLTARNGHPVTLWLRNARAARVINEERRNPSFFEGAALAEGLSATTSLAEAVRGRELVLVAVPSKAVREVAKALGSFIAGDQSLLSCTKGLEPGSNRRMSEILKAESCAKKVGVLSGPNLAAEVAAGQPSATVVASRFDDVIEMGARYLHGNNFRVYGNNDVIGVELAGALKNVIAIAAGICRGLGFGDNTRALLITRGLAEIGRYGTFHGADPATFIGLAGVGDLMVTCASPLSRNHQVGYRLGQGERLDAILADLKHVAEGVGTTRAVHPYAEEHGIEMPIASGMHRILFDGVPPREVLQDLMSRRARYEVDRTAGEG